MAVTDWAAIGPCNVALAEYLTLQFRSARTPLMMLTMPTSKAWYPAIANSVPAHESDPPTFPPSGRAANLDLSQFDEAAGPAARRGQAS